MFESGEGIATELGFDDFAIFLRHLPELFEVKVFQGRGSDDAVGRQDDEAGIPCMAMQTKRAKLAGSLAGRGVPRLASSSLR